MVFHDNNLFMTYIKCVLVMHEHKLNSPSGSEKKSLLGLKKISHPLISSNTLPHRLLNGCYFNRRDTLRTH